MKKFFVMAALSVAAMQPALAQQEIYSNQADEYADAQVLNEQTQMEAYGNNAGAVIGGAIVGGVIGGIIGNQNRDHSIPGSGDYDYGRPGWGRPGPGGPGWGRPRPPGPGPRFVCYARNWRGETFRGMGPDPRWAEQRAMDECYRYSRRCEPIGCDRF